MTTISHDFKRVFVWEAPVRLFHWINVLAILTLAATGIIIGNPPAIMSGAEATNQYWFGINRYIHFISAYILTFNMLYRMFWSYMGNKYANWKQFFPYNKKGIKNTLFVLKHHVLLQNEKVYDFRKNIIGHNPIAAISYSLLFILMLIQIFTGFGLYADNSTWFFPKLFAWVPSFLGGDMNTRLIHHITTWGFIIFTIIHVYLAMWHDWLEGRGEISSMFGGYKFIRKERLKKEEEKND
ncbi:MAG: Ni/Fe-hydrogenase, b-type cytochrome subunit [Cyclobacteriaceae bacterium]|nr:Ni/Fe-hydrogenase, b-type cytochrome subunit [Cyclobacteriaceae bacterium]